MNIRKTLKSIDNTWFYSPPPFWMRFLLIYVKGDILILLPFTLIVLIVGLWDVRTMLLMTGLYILFRGLGEIIYWLLQQFGEKKYRPYDLGLENIDNNAIYIIYQLISLVHVVLGGLLVGLVL